ncbi:G-protein coupled receptor GRL101-like [Aplysia californica]|uniref:G-protein coupled receptor GRL101-like n=1 Tax=Aplysia californica TaxID=6500 RepID=A0ABM1VQ96_APLCA|nr:G-protein coupled receptor GRL101-like [Aplysia californica]
MREPLLRVLLWLVGLSALLGNVVVIVYRAVWDRGFLQKGYALFVFNLIPGVADLLMGAYLMIVAVADVLFRGTYVWHERSWRMSDTCKVAGFLSTWSSESSAIFVFLITVDRFLVIKFPFGQVRLSPVGARVLCCFSWVGLCVRFFVDNSRCGPRSALDSIVYHRLIGLSIAVLPLLPPFQHWTVFSTSGMCVGLPLTTERKPGWEYSVTVFVGLNFVLFLLIAIGQILIYRQFRLYLCIIRLGLLALNGHEVSKDTYAWSAVLVVPINSALNPVLYTVPVIRKKWDEIKQNYFKTGTAFSKTGAVGDMLAPPLSPRRCLGCIHEIHLVEMTPRGLRGTPELASWGLWSKNGAREVAPDFFGDNG